MIGANEYFDGNVKSLAYESAEGQSTVGVMEPGDYEFGTSMHETMVVIEGALTVKLPGATEWKTYKNGDIFEVEANTSFHIKVENQTAYLCKYK